MSSNVITAFALQSTSSFMSFFIIAMPVDTFQYATGSDSKNTLSVPTKLDTNALLATLFMLPSCVACCMMLVVHTEKQVSHANNRIFHMSDAVSHIWWYAIP